MKNLPVILTLSALIALAGPLRAAESPSNSEPVDVLPAVGLSEELMFRYLSAEIALQRGDAFAAYATMFSIARSTNDPRLARRATEMAISAESVRMTGSFFKRLSCAGDPVLHRRPIKN